MKKEVPMLKKAVKAHVKEDLKEVGHLVKQDKKLIKKLKPKAKKK